MPLFWLYKNTMSLAKPVIHGLVKKRMKKGKEDPARIEERFGFASRPRPAGHLLWVHVASVGEAQSLLIFIHEFLKQNTQAHVLVTSITTTSAAFLASRLPERTIHQYLPIDRPTWVKRFLNHWTPDVILWAESELWPVLLHEIGNRHIPMALINARMSPKSFRNWQKIRSSAENILQNFTLILTQSDNDAACYEHLGGRSVTTVGNIKFAANPLPCDAAALKDMQDAIGTRPVWVYASTHDGEEELAIKTHIVVSDTIPDLLTIIVPRHPERRHDISTLCDRFSMPYALRGTGENLPDAKAQVYIADTLGELGLFYRLTPVAVIGRSFSKDGGGGHNPLEAALLDCAILHGPHVQNLPDIFTPMDACGAARCVDTAEGLATVLQEILTHPDICRTLQSKARQFAQSQSDVLNKVIEELEPLFLFANMPLMQPIKKDAP